MKEIVRYRVIFIALIFLLTSGVSCTLLSDGGTPGASTPQSPGSTPPSGWKVSRDPTGTCQVSTPPDWQLGKDFFLELERAEPSPFPQATAAVPPLGNAIWGDSLSTPAPEGKEFQLRTALVSGEQICSVWRSKTGTDFSEAEQADMDQVGQTLLEVR